MSYQDYREAMELAHQCRFYTTVGGRSQAEIRKAADRGVMKLFAVGDGFAGDVFDPRVAPIRERLMREFPHLGITSSAPGNVEIISPKAGKGMALSHVAGLLGMTRENVMAVGDAGNDLNMLEYAYHSVAMGNATDDVLACCRYRTSSNDDCGVAEIIERVIAAKEAADE